MMTAFRILLTIVMAAMFAGSIEAAEVDQDGGNKRFYIESGILFGHETEMPDYAGSRYRFLVDLGFERVNMPIKSIRSLERIGIAYNVALGSIDVRHCIGPRLTWKINDK